MGKNLNSIATELKEAKYKRKANSEIEADVKVQLIYAFNGTGKTRLSRSFKELVDPKNYEDEEVDVGLFSKKILYYNAFTEDLFYWDNDLENDVKPKLKIQPNNFTKWVFEEQGQEPNVIKNFQRYTDEKLAPLFNAEYKIKDAYAKEIIIENFSEVTFSYQRGNDDHSDNIKISKAEESCFIWSVFYSLLEQVIETLNIDKDSISEERGTDQFDNLEYVFIDDPVSSLDDNHLIELAVDLAQLIKKSKSELKFIITTHNPLFYNVLYNEFKDKKSKKYLLKKDELNEYDLIPQNSDAPFSYHLFLKVEIEKAIATGQLKKYHFNYLRNILEKTATFLGYGNWGELLPKVEGDKINPYESRIINISSHSKHSAEEIIELSDNDKRVLSFLLKEIKKDYKFK